MSKTVEVLFLSCVLFLLPLSLVSCEDKEQLALADAMKDQEARMEELDQQLEQVGQEIERKRIADPGPRLDELRESIRAVDEEIEVLQAGLATTQGQLDEETQKLRDYQAKYRISKP